MEGRYSFFLSFYGLYFWSVNLIVISLTDLIFLNFNLEVSGNTNLIGKFTLFNKQSHAHFSYVLKCQ